MTDDLTNEPDDLAADLDAEPLDLAKEIRGMRRDFRGGFARLERERVGRRGTNRLAVIVLVGALMVGGVFAWSYVERGRVTCETRIASRSDTRAGIGAAADEVAVYANDELGLTLTEAERAELNRRVAARVLQELPDPC